MQNNWLKLILPGLPLTKGVWGEMRVNVSPSDVSPPSPYKPQKTDKIT